MPLIASSRCVPIHPLPSPVSAEPLPPKMTRQTGTRSDDDLLAWWNRLGGDLQTLSPAPSHPGRVPRSSVAAVFREYKAGQFKMFLGILSALDTKRTWPRELHLHGQVCKADALYRLRSYQAASLVCQEILTSAHQSTLIVTCLEEVQMMYLASLIALWNETTPYEPPLRPEQKAWVQDWVYGNLELSPVSRQRPRLKCLRGLAMGIEEIRHKATDFFWMVKLRDRLRKDTQYINLFSIVEEGRARRNLFEVEDAYRQQQKAVQALLCQLEKAAQSPLPPEVYSAAKLTPLSAKSPRITEMCIYATTAMKAYRAGDYCQFLTLCAGFDLTQWPRPLRLSFLAYLAEAAYQTRNFEYALYLCNEFTKFCRDDSFEMTRLEDVSMTHLASLLALWQQNSANNMISDGQQRCVERWMFNTSQMSLFSSNLPRLYSLRGVAMGIPRLRNKIPGDAWIADVLRYLELAHQKRDMDVCDAR
jgi:hypothetical protein